MDLVHYGLYITPREVSDPTATKAALLAALPTLSLAHLDTALTGPHKQYYLAGDINPEVKDRIHDLALPGVNFAEESARTYPLGETGVHVIGFAGKDGRGLAGAEKAFDTQIRDAAGKEPVALSIDLRVQGALQDELNTAAEHFGVQDAVGMVVNVRTGEILGMASWPHFDPNQPGKANPASMVNHAAATVYEPGSVFKVFTLAMGLDAGTTTVDKVYDVHTPLVLPAPDHPRLRQTGRRAWPDAAVGGVHPLLKHRRGAHGAGVGRRQHGSLLARLRPLPEGAQRTD